MNIVICTKKDPFSDLKSLAPKIHKISTYILKYLERDRRAVCFYARLIAEQLVSVVFALKKIDSQADCLRDILKTAAAKQIIGTEAIAKIERIAKAGNKAAHQLIEPNAHDTLNCLRDLLDLVRWFVAKFYRVDVNTTRSSQIFKFDTKENRDRAGVKLTIVPSLIDEFIKFRPKQNTRIIYQKVLSDFCKLIHPTKPIPTAIKILLDADEPTVLKMLYDYRQFILEQDSLSNATISQRISIVNSFVNYAFSRGYYRYRVAIPSVPRDKSATKSTTIDGRDWTNLLDSIDRNTVKGTRDYAILQLLIQERIDCQDINRIELTDCTQSQLSIVIEGSPRPKIVTLSQSTQSAIGSWLKLRPQIVNKYLFISLSRGLKNIDTPLSQRGIYDIIKNIGKAANLDYRLNVRSIVASLN